MQPCRVGQGHGFHPGSAPFCRDAAAMKLDSAAATTTAIAAASQQQQ